ncbi:hypothetical protein [Streptomyces sp. H27-D2]|uniref:hypothetical protein n=1 Tax=Streptomyces sp. H27-D2 TaxID=3046304 RepID=UPI002DB8FC6C|nr:hypothetical protein [Streptomyces sp. H27-D2]MEC4018461.1 hypothetical protein [Streptomyces sp. H27-D2]
MSRESDSSSSGPHGRGAAAYPSGTPSYGSRQYPSADPTQDDAYDSSAPAGSDAAPRPESPAKDEGPKTETTLTTRIRINIPGSRPIPPLVVRTPVADGNDRGKDAERTGNTPRPAPAAPAAPVGQSGPPAAPDGAPGPGQAPGGNASAPAPSDWFAPRKGGTQGGGAAPGPVAPAPASDTTGTSPRPDLPYFTDTPAAPPGGAGPGGFGGGAAAGGRPPGGPAGPTSGPAGGDSPLLPPAFRQNAGPGTGPPPGSAPGGPGTGAPFGSGLGSAPGVGPNPPMSDDTAPMAPQPPGPAGGGPGFPGGPLNAFTPNGPGQDNPAGDYPPGGPAGPGGPGEHVSGDTLVSGIPKVPSAGGPTSASPSPFAPGGPGGPVPAPPYDGDTAPPRAAATPAASAPAAGRAAKKGRSKLMLAAVAIVVVAGVAYGAGLLLDHADVPNGTTVLGTEIGGTSKEEAVKKLDAALGDRPTAPLKLTVGDRPAELTPRVAGLAIDTQATVRGAAGRDYNPVSVIGSLVGGARAADPVVTIDEEKLTVALQGLSGASGAAQDGTIEFTPGKAVAVPGKTHEALDVESSVDKVAAAYRDRAATGRNTAVQLAVSMRKPAVSQAEIDRKMKEFAIPAMSGLVTIKAGDASIPFGPDRSLPKILSMRQVDGKLVEHYDRAALKQLYGNVFDGVLITRGNGSKTPVQPTDVAAALGQALRGKTPAERTRVIETNAN